MRNKAEKPSVVKSVVMDFSNWDFFVGSLGMANRFLNGSSSPD